MFISALLLLSPLVSLTLAQVFPSDLTAAKAGLAKRDIPTTLQTSYASWPTPNAASAPSEIYQLPNIPVQAAQALQVPPSPNNQSPATQPVNNRRLNNRALTSRQPKGKNVFIKTTLNGKLEDKLLRENLEALLGPPKTKKITHWKLSSSGAKWTLLAERALTKEEVFELQDKSKKRTSKGLYE